MQRLDIQLKPSSIFIGLTGFFLISSVLIVLFVLSVSGFFKVILMMSVLAYSIWIFWAIGLMKSSYSIVGLQLLADGLSHLHYASHKMTANLTGDSIMTTTLCVLRFSVPGQRRKVSCIIFKDSVEPERYRQLLLWLRCNKLSGFVGG
jgi:hypothetical protein